MPNENEIDNGETLDSVGGTDTESGQPTVSDQAQSDTNAISLDEIQSFLGKKFDSKETALKSIKDTFNYVGRKTEDAAKLAEETLAKSGEYVRRSEIETEFFYRDNPNAAKHRVLVDAVAKANNISAREASERVEVKKVLEAASAFEEQETAKTVMQSNSRLGATRDKIQEAKKLMGEGRSKEAESILVDAAFEGI